VKTRLRTRTTMDALHDEPAILLDVDINIETSLKHPKKS